MEIADIRVFEPAAVDRYRIREKKNETTERKNKVVYTQATSDAARASTTIRNNNTRKPTEKIQFSTDGMGGHTGSSTDLIERFEIYVPT